MQRSYKSKSRASPYSRPGGYLSAAAASKRALVYGPIAAYAPAAPKRNRAPKIKGSIAPFGGRKELKYVDIAAGDLACDTTGSVSCLNLLAVGDDNNTRDGRQCTIKSVQLKGQVAANSAAVNPQKARVMLVWDNAVNSGTIATIAQILTASTANSFPLVDNAQRFTVLWDSNYVLGLRSTVATSSVADAVAYDVDYYRKLDNVTQYSGTTAAIGSIQNGGLLLVTIGSVAAGTAAATLNIATRVRFTDN